MPSKKEHLIKADNSESLSLHSLDPANPAAAEWALTMLFYVALHYVEAYFSLKGEHYKNHGPRDAAIKRDPTLGVIYRDYRELYVYSREARYEAVSFTFSDIRDVTPHLNNIKNKIRSLLPA